jgi:hypothetical protein
MKADLMAWDKAQSKPMWPSLGAGPIAIDKNLNQKIGAGDEYVFYGN